MYKLVYRMKISHYVRSWSEGNYSKYFHTTCTLYFLNVLIYPEDQLLEIGVP